jgi:anti-sigma factor RsiW
MTFNDEMLTAYLDGELDAPTAVAVREMCQKDHATAQRLAALEIDRSALKRDYAALAGSAQLDALRSKLALDVGKAPSIDAKGYVRRMQFAAACAACLVLGALSVWSIGLLREQPKSWREAVAEYQVLYAAETVSWNSQTPDQIDETLDKLSGRVGVKLDRERLSLDRAGLRRGQLLTFNGKALVQVVFLHAGQTPVAFCFTPDGAQDAAPMSETREGLPIVHWAKGGVSYMVIGDVPKPELAMMAEALRKRI